MAGPTQARGSPAPFVVEPTAPHTRTFILLHGLGSNGEKFGKELLDTGKTSSGLTLPQLFPGAKFIFPTAKRRRSTAFGRSMLNMWFDPIHYQDPPLPKELQVPGLADSATDLLELIQREAETNQLGPENIVLGGLSQGCAMSLSLLLCLDHPIGGFIGMSGYLPFREDIDEAMEDPPDDEDNPFSCDEAGHDKLDPVTRASVFERDLLELPPVENPEAKKTAQATPIFLGHGAVDEKVPCFRGEAMSRTVQAAGYKTRWKRYEGLWHWYKIPDEIDDIVEFLRGDVGWQVENTEAT